MISLFRSFTFLLSCSSGVRPLLPLLTLLTSLLVFSVIIPSYYYESYNSCRCYIYNTEKVRYIIAPEKTAFISNIFWILGYMYRQYTNIFILNLLISETFKIIEI